MWEETATNQELRSIQRLNMSEDHDEDVSIRFNPPLGIQRYQYASNILFKEESRIVRMADFGCAEGRFFRHLKKLPFVEEVNLVDISRPELDEAAFQCTPIAWDFIFGRFVEMTLNLYQGSVIEPDDRFIGLDAITMIELIEHLNEETLAKLPPNIFGYLQPRIVIISTPNAEFNVLFTQLQGGQFRHWDHKFEWTRPQFQSWCYTVAENYNYEVTFDGVGEPIKGKTDIGFCSQFAIFRRKFKFDALTSVGAKKYDLLHSFNFPKRSKALDKSEEKGETFDWDMILSDVRSRMVEEVKIG